MVELEQVTLDVIINRKRRRVLTGCDFSFDAPRMAILAEDPTMRSSVVGLVTGRILPQRGRIKRSGRVSWAIGPTLPFRSNLTGRQTISFICDVHGVSRARGEALARTLIDVPFELDLPTTRWSIPAVIQLSYTLALLPSFDIYIIDGPIRLGYPSFFERWSSLFEERVRRRPLIVSSAQTVLLPRVATVGAVLRDGALIRTDDVARHLKPSMRQARAADDAPDDTGDGEDFDLL